MLLSCGDALIDFMPASTADGRDAYVPVVGGSCLNVAVAMARLDAPAGLVGGISTDLFGSMIAEHALGSNVDLRFATRSPDETTLAFVRLVRGEPEYVFYDEATAARRWIYRPGSIPFDEVDAVHVGSTTLIGAAVAAQTLSMLAEARSTTTISFDPNCRPNLVRDKAEYAERMQAFLGCADIVRMSDADFEFLFRSNDYASAAAGLIEGGATLVVITRGARGVLAWHRRGTLIELEVPRVAVVDTIGAGDTFQGALLAALWEMRALARRNLGAMEPESLCRALRFAASCAAVTCARPGADPPRRSELPAATP